MTTVFKKLAGDRLARRSHESRSAAMRLRLIHAAIESLHEVGYAGSTIAEILSRAGVSRGAMLHHFPTKVDLMLDTAEYIVAWQAAHYDEQLALIPEPVERLVAITPITWLALKQPTGMALLEILMATRSDADLRARFPSVAQSIELIQQRGMWVLAKAAGIEDRVAVRTLTDTFLATMRGLSIQLLFTKDHKTVELAMEMVVDWKRKIVERLIASSAVI